MFISYKYDVTENVKNFFDEETRKK